MKNALSRLLVILSIVLIGVGLSLGSYGAGGVAGISSPPIQKKMSVYFAAHQDDWQLFMGADVGDSIARDGSKTVIVHLTAGDAGEGFGKYVLAREAGALASGKFALTQRVFAETLNEEHLNMNGHIVLRVSSPHLSLYFLRLADGNPAGTGYDSTGRVSLKRLLSGRVGKIEALDHSTIYEGSADLTAVLQKIVADEYAGLGVTDAPLYFGFPETDVSLNPGDHADHLATGRLAERVIKIYPEAVVYKYIDYAISKRPANLRPEQENVQRVLFAESNRALVEHGVPSDWDETHLAWLGRMYVRLYTTSGTRDISGLPTRRASADAFDAVTELRLNRCE